MTNSLLLLMGLLLVAYLGSFLVGGRAVRGVGLPSSVEWVVLGFVIGPRALGVVSQSLVLAVQPIVIVALSWLLLVDGVQFRSSERGPVRFSRFVLGALWGAASAAVVSVAVYYALPFVARSLMPDRLIVSLALGAASAETTRHVIRWVRERHNASGPLVDMLDDIAATDDVIPVGMLVAMSAIAGKSKAAWLGPAGVAGVTVGLGILLGALCALLLGREFRLRESWGTLFGLSLLGIGVSAQIGLSYLAVLFVLGLVLATMSRHAGEVRVMLAPTERGALLPTLILCGVRLDPGNLKQVGLLFLVVFAGRLIGKLVTGWLLAGTSAIARPAGGLVGLAMLSSGSLTMCIGLASALTLRGPVGDTVLTISALLCITGELFGPPSLRAALRRAGELHPVETPEPAAAPAEETSPGGSS